MRHSFTIWIKSLICISFLLCAGARVDASLSEDYPPPIDGGPPPPMSGGPPPMGSKVAIAKSMGDPKYANLRVVSPLRMDELGKSIPNDNIFKTIAHAKLPESIVEEYVGKFCVPKATGSIPTKTTNSGAKKVINFLDPKATMKYSLAIVTILKVLGIKEQGEEGITQMLGVIESHDDRLKGVMPESLRALIPTKLEKGLDYPDFIAANTWLAENQIDEDDAPTTSMNLIRQLPIGDRYIMVLKNMPPVKWMIKALASELEISARIEIIRKDLDKLMPFLEKTAKFKELDQILQTSYDFVKTINGKVGTVAPPNTLALTALMQLCVPKEMTGKGFLIDLLAKVAVEKYPDTKNFSKVLSQTNVRDVVKINILELSKELATLNEELERLKDKCLRAKEKYEYYGGLDVFLKKHEKAISLLEDSINKTKGQMEKAQDLLGKTIRHYGKQPIFYQPEKPEKDEETTLHSIKELCPPSRWKKDAETNTLFAYFLDAFGGRWDAAVKRNEDLEKAKHKSSNLTLTSPRTPRSQKQEVDIKDLIGQELKGFDKAQLRSVGK